MASENFCSCQVEKIEDSSYYFHLSSKSPSSNPSSILMKGIQNFLIFINLAPIAYPLKSINIYMQLVKLNIKIEQ
jgi:hypothetical protein